MHAASALLDRVAQARQAAPVPRGGAACGALSVSRRRPGAAAAQRPPESARLDYEGEIAIVIGKGGRRISEADA